MEVSLSDIRKLLGAPAQPEHGPWVLGKQYLIRTVTMIVSGSLVAVYDQELVLRNAAWIADTGRFHDTLKNPSNLNEAEPFVHDAIVGRGSIVDATEWPHEKIGQK